MTISFGAPLPQEFYERDTLTVARDLLGCYLHRRLPADLAATLARDVSGTAFSTEDDTVHFPDEDDTVLIGRITETEGYLGLIDDAAHSHRGPTPRTQIMFGPPGRAYVYLIYGMWWCTNVVTRPAGIGEAVLIRGIEPVHGEEKMRVLRRGAKALADGPGKLSQAMAITGSDNGADLGGNELFITRPTVAARPEGTGRALVFPVPHKTAPRVGIDYATTRDKPWRFIAE